MFAGVGAFVKLILRRDRVKLPVLVASFSLILLAMIPMLREVYGEQTELDTLFVAFGTNPAGLFLTGPMNAPTFGGLMSIETLLWWGLAIALINTTFIVRHTRQNEEMGSQELLLSGRTHRSSGLVAALAVAFVMNFGITLVVGLGFSVMEPSWGVESAWVYAVAMGLFGFVWAGVAAVVVQLLESARSANSALVGLVGVAFVVRGVGDFLGRVVEHGLHEPVWVSFLSPFGWLQATRPLVQPDWQPLLWSAGFAVVVITLAFWLLQKRDVAAGILPTRRGKARASRLLASSHGLTFYLQKNVFVGWLLGVLTMTVTIGVLVPQMSHVYDSSPDTRRIIESIGGSGALVPSFLSAMLLIVALMVFAYAVQAVGRLRSEESQGHLENLLATRLSRLRWAGLHVVSVLFGAALMLVAAGASLALAVNATSDFQADVLEYVLAGLSYWPIATLLIGMYVLLFGLAPRFAGAITWSYYGYVAFMSWLGPMLNLDKWVMDLAVTTHVPTMPVEPFDGAVFWTMSIAALVMLNVGFWFWRQRNLLEM